MMSRFNLSPGANVGVQALVNLTSVLILSSVIAFCGLSTPSKMPSGRLGVSGSSGKSFQTLGSAFAEFFKRVKKTTKTDFCTLEGGFQG